MLDANSFVVVLQISSLLVTALGGLYVAVKTGGTRSLVQEVKTLREENSDLRAEQGRLKRRVEYLEAEDDRKDKRILDLLDDNARLRAENSSLKVIKP